MATTTNQSTHESGDEDTFENVLKDNYLDEAVEQKT